MNDNVSEEPVAPEAANIEHLLGRFQPKPGSRFYKLMLDAPWTKSHPPLKHGFFRPMSASRRLVLGSLLFLLFITVLGFTLYPPLRGIAHQIMYSFIPAPEDQLELQVTLANPGDLYGFADPENFPLDIPAVQLQAGFSVSQITSLPTGLSFTGARYDVASNASILLYQGKDYKLFLTQRPIGNGQDVFSIGASAQVEMVLVGNVQGEYVMGGWKVTSEEQAEVTPLPGAVINLSAVWDSTLPQYTLRWQSGGFVYELRSIGIGSPAKSQLVSLANGLK